MLDRASWVDDIKMRMGFPVVNLAITDEMILRQVELSIRKALPYINSREVFEVSSKVSTFTDRVVYTVVSVNSAKASHSSHTVSPKHFPMGIITIGGRTGRTIIDSTLIRSYLNEVSYLDKVRFRFVRDSLYIDGGNPPYTVEAITEDSLFNMSEDYVNWCFEYSLALVKCIEGEIRSKVKITGSPVETNGSQLLDEGNSEKSRLEEQLGSSLALYIATR